MLRLKILLLRKYIITMLISSDLNKTDRCGGFVSAGERGGANPEVLMFELSSGRCVATLAKGHKQGVGAIAFSPDGETVIGMTSSYRECPSPKSQHTPLA